MPIEVEVPKKREKELPKIERMPTHHPIETFSRMATNMSRKSESAYFNVPAADAHIRMAENADKLAKFQKPLGSRFYQLIRSL